MSSRRHFLHSLAGASAALPMFRESAMRHVVRATDRLSTVDPAAAADDEAYWGEIQRAFDTDHTMINLNHGDLFLEVLRSYGERDREIKRLRDKEIEPVEISLSLYLPISLSPFRQPPLRYLTNHRISRVKDIAQVIFHGLSHE